MKIFLLILLLGLSLFGKDNDPESISYIEKNGHSKYVSKLSLSTFASDPNIFFIQVKMINKSNKTVAFQLIQEYNMPLRYCTFEYLKNYEKESSLRFDNACNILSDKGAQKFVINLLNNIESKLEYVYNEGE